MARAAPAATRATSILAFLTANPARGFRISELAERLGMNLASAHATLAVLCDAGFLLRDPVHRTYVLGPALAVTGFAALEQHPAVEAAIEQAELLADELGAEIGVTAIAGRDVIFLAGRGGPAPLAAQIAYPGDRSPLMAPIGAIFMPWADDDAVDEWLARAELAPAVATFYRRVLAEIRERGFSVPMQPIVSPAVREAIARVRSEPTDPDAEHHLAEVLQQTDEMLILLDDLSGSDEILYKTIAAPIFDPIGQVLLSLSITGPDHAVAVDEILRLGHRLAQAAAVATRRVRGRAPGEQPIGSAVSGGST
jgi:DNA-binding IclR family transcriptional regulator